MNSNKSFFAVVLMCVVFALFWSAKYFVDETQQVVITQFGEPIGEPIQKAGLHFKIPGLQKANYFDKRILQWDGEQRQIPTFDKRYIWVDTTARWRIVDPLKFMQSVGTEMGAHAQLDAIIEGATLDTISNLALVETIRNSNRLVESRKKDKAASDSFDFELSNESVEAVKVGREQMTNDILKKSAPVLKDYGIELVDVLIKRINYVKEVRKKVYERMVSERNRAAEKYRSEGQGKKAEIEGQRMKELQQIQSEAYRKAQEVKGKADATATKIYAEAYNKDADFYSFLKTLDTYKTILNSDSVLILSTGSDLFQYLKKQDPLFTIAE